MSGGFPALSVSYPFLSAQICGEKGLLQWTLGFIENHLCASKKRQGSPCVIQYRGIPDLSAPSRMNQVGFAAQESTGD